jgi:hypothetical protein
MREPWMKPIWILLPSICRFGFGPAPPNPVLLVSDYASPLIKNTICWDGNVQVSNANGITAEPTSTIFHPEARKGSCGRASNSTRKEFLLPLEYGYTRTAHHHLETPDGNGTLKVTSKVPSGFHL